MGKKRLTQAQLEALAAGREKLKESNYMTKKRRKKKRGKKVFYEKNDK